MSIWAEALESRTLMASQGLAVLWDDRQVLIADQSKIRFDKHEIRAVAADDRRAGLILTNSDRARIRLDNRQLHKDQRLDPMQVPQDLIDLEADQQQLHSDFLSARATAIQHQAPLIVQLNADRQQRATDYKRYRADGGT